jgi:hypothetical protein
MRNTNTSHLPNVCDARAPMSAFFAPEARFLDRRILPLGVAFHCSTPRRKLEYVIRTGARVLVAMILPLAQVHAERAMAGSLAGDELKRIYLSCNRAAIESGLSADGIMACSMVYEQLKVQVFDGNFDKLFAWSQANPLVQRAQDKQARGCGGRLKGNHCPSP